MIADDLMTDPELARAIADEASQLPAPPEGARETLRQRLDHSARPPTDAAWPAVLQAPREKKDTRYADPATSHRPVVGPLVVLAKRSFRKLFQPFINEVMRRQVEFNEAILDSLALIYDQQQERARAEARWRAATEERLAKLEEKDMFPRTPAGTPRN
jgi:hypothetical protein